MQSLVFFLTSFLAVLSSEQAKGSHISSRLKRACPGSSETGSQLPCIPARTNCVLPEYLENGFWRVFGEPERNAGEIVPVRTVLEFKCDSGYKLLPEVQFAVCNQQWSVLPLCIKTCDSLQSTDVMQIGCSLYDTEISCTNPYNGSRARISCAPTYNDPSLQDRPYRNCIDGKWDGPLPECRKGVENDTCAIPLSTSVAPQITGPTCILPEYPKNGRWYNGHIMKPGHTVAPGTLIKYICNKGYKEYPENNIYVICLNGTFAAPTCQRTCSTLQMRTSTTFANCYYRGQPTSCKYPYMSTRVRFSCAHMYKMPPTMPHEMACVDGLWGNPEPTCTQVCGVRSLSPLKLTMKEILNTVPWMTNIYEKDKFICAGTLIAPNVVITAASKLEHSMERYTVLIKDSRGEKQQESNIADLFKHDNFQDLVWRHNIAIIILETPFKISETVLPVCLDYTSSLNNMKLNETGYIAGYTTIDGKPSSGPLKSVEMLYQTRKTCPVPSNFGTYFEGSVFCAINRVEGETMITGYRSSGLVVQGSDGLYYLRGIFSLSNFYGSPETWLFNPVFFTDISENMDFIIRTLKYYKNTI